MFGKPFAVWQVVIRRLAIDLLIVNVALVGSLALALEWPYLSTASATLLSLHLPLTVVGLLALIGFRTYRISSRYAGLIDILNIVIVGVLLGTGLSISLMMVSPAPATKENFLVSVLFSLVFIASWATSRFVFKLIQFPHLVGIGSRRGSKRILIVGAGDAGDMVARELSKLKKEKPYIVGFIDDDIAKLGTTIQGIPVLGTVEDLEDLSDRYHIDEVHIAIPSATGQSMRRIWEECAKVEVLVRTLPSFEELVGDRSRLASKLREFRVEDLLRRDSHADEIEVVSDYLEGETVLITGGGGSIGSELARQVSQLNPATLILLGKGENSVFEVDQELKSRGFKSSIPIVCDVRDRDSVSRILEKFKPTIIFHAAAHKHVPLMEAVPIEAIRNNIFGTLTVAEEATKIGVKKFILVSTDKAVNPRNVMGATKRVAEMVVTSLATRKETAFSVVRFGNVLGSRGSLVPILQRQISQGGPLTITHPDMTRFFMTIPEASKLIVQAGATGDKGEIYILDMGEPVKIVDLANDLIRMHGMVPGKDIEIEITGIRPGEKMHEELSYASEQLKESGHPRILRVASEKPIDWDWLKGRIEELDALCHQGDTEAAKTYLLDIAWAKNMPPIAVVPTTKK